MKDELTSCTFQIWETQDAELDLRVRHLKEKLPREKVSRASVVRLALDEYFNNNPIKK